MIGLIGFSCVPSMGNSTPIQYCHCSMQHLEGREYMLQMHYATTGLPMIVDQLIFSVVMDEGFRSNWLAELQNPITYPPSTAKFYIGPFDAKIRKHGDVDRIGTRVLPHSKYVAYRACTVCLLSDISMDIQGSPCSHPLPRHPIPATEPNLGQSGQCRRKAQPVIEAPSGLRLRGNLAGIG